ncbi:AfsR/SARP family transcriptional regulator [Glycomyces sp. MUSA5-2]|uniref:AfsR/SARP family transcriptional regulator n=1 Tax=Glycomyces sp. MUSA5-2 TaxID=2053002 RepID=UPI003009C250
MDGRTPAAGPVRTRFRVLGPVEILRDGNALGPTTAQLRCVLALLLLDLGRAVTAERLIAALWPAGPPASALNTVRVYVTRLRRLLAGDPAVALATVGRGWRLDCDPAQVDLYRFRDLVSRARRGEAPGTGPLLDEALRLWRGPALADIAGDEWREGLRTGLEEERLAALEDRLAHDIAAGAARDVVPELAALVAGHPVRERPAQLLMAALGDSGRTAEALALYRKTRRFLVDELGVEPGPGLQREHRRLLGRSREEAARLDRPVPHQLPADIAGFTGRAEELARLDRGAGPVAVVTGIPGSGKTTLAVHWAHRAAGDFPDGNLWADLRGFDPAGRALDPGVVLGVFLDALGVPPAQVPASAEARSALYRSLLAERRMLVVLDNARDEDQVRPLLPGTDACRVLITARTSLAGLVARHGLRPVALDVLGRGDARDLLAERIGARRADAEPEAVARIIDQCARLPLALAVVAARAAGIPGAPLDALADELEAGTAPLDGFAFADDSSMDLRSAFACSYRALSPAAARTFRLLGLHWGPDFTAEAAAALTGEPPAAARLALGELVRLGLAGEFRTGRFRLHDLLAAYAAELAAAEDGEAARRDAVERLLDRLLRSADTAAAAITPFPLADDGDHVSGAALAAPERRERAAAWFESERAVLLGAVEEAFKQEFHTHAWQLARSLETYLRRQNAAAEREAVHRTALRAAERANSVHGLASAHLGLGMVQSNHGDKAEARKHLEQALAHFGTAGDWNGQADTCLVLCVLDGAAGDFAATLEHAVRGLELYARAGNTAGRVRALNNIGFCHARLGDPAAARDHCLAALDLAVGIGDTIGEANVLDSLGTIEAQLGEYARAVEHLSRAVELGSEAGERNFTAAALTSLGETHAAAGQMGEARTAWQRAAVILDELGHPGAAAVRARLAGS